MEILVEYINQLGEVSEPKYEMSLLAFVKHMAIAGQAYAPKPRKFFRTVGMFLHYNQYLRREEFDNNRFSQPPRGLSDPTEQAHFSNLAGKAIADFLSKRIDRSLYTVNYEALMRLQGRPIAGKRPDLVSFTSNSTFAIEAKGRSQNTAGDMIGHKAQASSGPIPVNFAIACISFNLFDEVRCNYHDPFNDNIPYDNDSLIKLTKRYYSGLLQFLNIDVFEVDEFELQGENFYEIRLTRQGYEKLFPRDRHHLFLYYLLRSYYMPRLILPRNIRDYAKNGITNQIRPFIFEGRQLGENIYIDNDRVGLRVNRQIDNLAR